MNEVSFEVAQRRLTPERLSLAAVAVEIAAAVIGMVACYRRVIARGQGWPSATQLYAASLVVGLVGVVCAIPGRAYRLTVIALFLVTIGLGLFPATLPAVMFSP